MKLVEVATFHCTTFYMHRYVHQAKGSYSWRQKKEKKNIGQLHCYFPF